MTTRPTLPQNYAKSSGTLVEGFEGTTGWAVQDSKGTIEEDTVNFRTGSKSLKLNITTAGDTCYCDKALGQVLTGNSFEFWVYLADPSKILSIILYFGKDSLHTWSNYKRILIGANTWTKFRTGWNNFKVCLADFTTTGTMAWTDTVSQMRVRISAQPSQTGSASFDSLYQGTETIPQVLIMFDNGYCQQYDNAYPILAAAGLRATVGVNSDLVGTGNHMTIAELSELYAAGWAIANHTKDHTSLDGLSTIQDNYDKIAPCSEWIEAQGFSRAARHVVYPDGRSTDAYTRPALIQAGILTARGTAENFLNSPLSTDRYNLYAYQLEIDRAVSKVYGKIDDAIRTGSTLMLYTHIIKTSGATGVDIDTAYFQNVINYIKSKGTAIKCVTIDEWYNGLTNPRYRSLPLGRA